MKEVASLTKSLKTIEGEKSNFFVKSWIIWGCAALFYCYQFALRVSPSIMAEDLMGAFHVDACALGALTAFYYNTYSALQIPVGTLMDRFKPRRMLAFATILCGVGTLLFSLADSLYLAAFGRAIIGAGSAFAFLSCLKLATIWFPSQKLPFVVGMTLLLGTVGASSGYPLAWLVEASGWRYSLWLIAFIGFGLSLLAWLIVRDTPPDELEEEVLASRGGSTEATPQKEGILVNLVEVLKKPQSWLIALYGSLMYVPLSGFADLWGPSFIMSAYKADKTTAGGAITVLYVGIGLGAPLFPLLCQYIKAYKPAIFLASFGALVFLSATLYISHLPFWTLLSFLFLTGFFLGGQFLAFSITCTLNPLSASATAGGFHNMICMLSGVIFQPFIGYLLQSRWKGTYNNGVPNYLPSDYTFALSSIIIALTLACFIVFTIEEKYHK